MDLYFGNLEKMFKLNDFKKIGKWYSNSLGKLLLFFIIVVIVSLMIVYTPYLNFIFTPTLRMFVILVSFYLLFPLSVNKLVIVSFVIVFADCIFVILGIDFVAEALGNLLYLILIFIFINYVKLIVQEKGKF